VLARRLSALQTFRIEIAPDVLSDLRRRLENTRWPHQPEGPAWSAGTDVHYLDERPHDGSVPPAPGASPQPKILAVISERFRVFVLSNKRLI
jgi:hypothetical protein